LFGLLSSLISELPPVPISVQHYHFKRKNFWISSSFFFILPHSSMWSEGIGPLTEMAIPGSRTTEHPTHESENFRSLRAEQYCITTMKDRCRKDIERINSYFWYKKPSAVEWQTEDLKEMTRSYLAKAAWSHETRHILVPVEYMRQWFLVEPSDWGARKQLRSSSPTRSRAFGDLRSFAPYRVVAESCSIDHADDNFRTILPDYCRRDSGRQNHSKLQSSVKFRSVVFFLDTLDEING